MFSCPVPLPDGHITFAQRTQEMSNILRLAPSIFTQSTNCENLQKQTENTREVHSGGVRWMFTRSLARRWMRMETDNNCKGVTEDHCKVDDQQKVWMPWMNLLCPFWILYLRDVYAYILSISMLLTMYRHSIYFIFPPSAFSAVVNGRIPKTSREDTADVSKMTTGKECLLFIYVMDDILYTISSKSFMQLKHIDG